MVCHRLWRVIRAGNCHSSPVKYTTTVIISGGDARLISVRSAPNCTQAKWNAHKAIEPNPSYVNQMASSATIANPNASAAAKPENPLAANGSPNTNSATTSSAADRLPGSPSVVPV
jgi:hypothetical protein